MRICQAGLPDRQPDQPVLRQRLPEPAGSFRQARVAGEGLRALHGRFPAVWPTTATLLMAAGAADRREAGRTAAGHAPRQVPPGAYAAAAWILPATWCSPTAGCACGRPACGGSTGDTRECSGRFAAAVCRRRSSPQSVRCVGGARRPRAERGTSPLGAFRAARGRGGSGPNMRRSSVAWFAGRRLEQQLQQPGVLQPQQRQPDEREQQHRVPCGKPLKRCAGVTVLNRPDFSGWSLKLRGPRQAQGLPGQSGVPAEGGQAKNKARPRRVAQPKGAAGAEYQAGCEPDVGLWPVGVLRLCLSGLEMRHAGPMLGE